MLSDQRAHTEEEDTGAATDEVEFRDIYALTPPSPQPSSSSRGRRRESWEASSHRWSTVSVGSDVLSEHLSTMSREFNAMVVAGASMQNDNNGANHEAPNLGRIGEEVEETNPLAIVPDNNPIPSPGRAPPPADSPAPVEEVSVHQVKKEEVESKISAWQAAEIAKINNRFKRDDVVINGWESEHIEKATAWLKKVERKLDEKRAKAIEKMQNDVAKSHRKAEERRASAEAKRGTKVAKVLDVANLLRAVGRAPSKRSLF
ncbi:remorin 4.1 [Elaeis guineensis]|uniref:Remorin 4.1 n=1 Tax=Elaeis guineensis var. tenera TaxID=51953 RepID=A0A6I9RAP0_ELAGV|nr:remorin 4.1 [Elaeis guineensis]